MTMLTRRWPATGMRLERDINYHMKSLDVHDETALISLDFEASNTCVRETLKTTGNALEAAGYGAEFRATVELVLAEILNNIVEHAYADQGFGPIRLTIIPTDGALKFEVVDHGVPMPNGNPPEGKPADLSCATEDLPEGGFGWFLIRELTHDFCYIRENEQNNFSFVVTQDES